MQESEVRAAVLVAVTTITITVFVRHSEGRIYGDDMYSRQCDCRKSLYIYENGKKSTQSCKTRSWKEAERIRQEELDKRDPVKKELARIAEQEEAKARRRAVEEVKLEDALTQWLAGMKDLAEASREAYTSMKNTMLRHSAFTAGTRQGASDTEGRF
jgi:hypothetical protein